LCVCFQRLSSGFCAILRYIFHGCLLRFCFHFGWGSFGFLDSS
jgi:hypothetical protein